VTARAARFAAVFAGLYAAHGISDYWLQTDHQANTKGQPDSTGHAACPRHAANYYTAVGAAATIGLNAALRLGISGRGLLAGQLISASTHYWADRRSTLRWLVHNGTPWNRSYYDNVPGAAERLDQSWHIGWLAVAALATVIL
jgi:hypothetical protein